MTVVSQKAGPLPVKPDDKAYGPWYKVMVLDHHLTTLCFEVDLSTAPDIFAAMFEIGIDRMGGNVFERFIGDLLVCRTQSIDEQGYPTLKAEGAMYNFPVFLEPPMAIAVRAMSDGEMPAVNVVLKAVKIDWSKV